MTNIERSEPEKTQMSVLGDIRVLDLSRVLAAPYATQILADLGADVIKVERPGTGDDARVYGVHALPDEQGRRSQDTSFFLAANRNKQSITLDFATPEGRSLLLRLVEHVDVLVENFKVGTMQRFGLDYEAVQKVKPSIIYCSVTGYGADGPYATRAGYDAIFQAQSGLMQVTGFGDSMPGGGPVKSGPSIVDVATGMNAALAIVAALRHRDRTGEGQQIDIALLDSAIALTSHSAMEFLIGGKTLPRNGNYGNGGAPAQALPCSNGLIYVSAGTQQQFIQLCAVLGLPALEKEDRFATSAKRYAHRSELSEVLAAITNERQAADLVDELSKAGVPAGVVNDYAAAFADPQVVHRGIRVEMPHPSRGNVSLIASPLRMSATPPSYRLTPPKLGQHNRDIYEGLLGLSEDEFNDLKSRGII
jgi:crotonobetainyl-CoA:carnitine CoA-transferase CaiB-like acyl-CoA transferase